MADAPDKRTHAQRRRKQAQDAMRQVFRGWQYVRRLREIANDCDEPGANIPALRLKADIYRGLLAKCLPDLKAIEHSGMVTQRHVSDLTDAELAAIATGRGAGTSEAESRPEEPAPVH